MDLADRLRRSEYRITEPRRIVWQILTDGHGHLTAHEILARAGGHDATLNLSSVYRTLGLFAELGLVRESNVGADGTARWEPAHDHDDDLVHLVCRSCGQVEHHEAESVRDLVRHLEADHGFVASGVEIEVRGQCQQCVRAAEAAARATA